jgi:hypothetical protein
LQKKDNETVTNLMQNLENNGNRAGFRRDLPRRSPQGLHQREIEPIDFILTFASLRLLNPHRWCLHFIVVVVFECSSDPESYAGGSVVTGRVTHAGQIKG